MSAIRDHQALAFPLQPEPVFREDLRQRVPGAGRPQLVEMPPHAVRERELARPLGLPPLAVGQERALGRGLALELVQPPGDLAEPELALQVAERAFDLGPVLPPLPRPLGLGMHPVHQAVHMGMRPVPVRHHQGLVLAEAGNSASTRSATCCIRSGLTGSAGSKLTVR